tara:strand:+ start:6961 stop:7512 length:552 start_codon:yes stop_codon:yes gene_type:complete
MNNIELLNKKSVEISNSINEISLLENESKCDKSESLVKINNEQKSVVEELHVTKERFISVEQLSKINSRKIYLLKLEENIRIASHNHKKLTHEVNSLMSKLVNALKARNETITPNEIGLNEPEFFNLLPNERLSLHRETTREIYTIDDLHISLNNEIEPFKCIEPRLPHLVKEYLNQDIDCKA